MSQESLRFTSAEELANAISHLVGTLLAIAGLVIMVIFSAIYGNAWHIVSTAIFGSTMTLLYLSSTLNHWLPAGKGKEFFFNFDQIAIFLLIAGTYTPITLVALHGTFGWVIFGLEWGLAFIGIVLKIAKPNKFESGVNIFNIILYLIMGWMILIVLAQVIRIMPFMGIMWIMIGAFFYTLGVLFFKLAKFKFHHLVWHLFVIGGSISHFFAIFFYVIPLSV